MICLSLLSLAKGILASELGASYGIINFPLRVRRIAHREAFCDRHLRLVGRQRSGATSTLHQHITPAIEPQAFSSWVLAIPGLLDHISEHTVSM